MTRIHWTDQENGALLMGKQSHKPSAEIAATLNSIFGHSRTASAVSQHKATPVDASGEKAWTAQEGGALLFAREARMSTEIKDGLAEIFKSNRTVSAISQHHPTVEIKDA
ncbi:hypothetical protein HDU87_008633 [Geranomyces variabilis]|uniref:Uncharacterized protein n=1 Tax=Geranomyces variabilis TaxID=109894 RepID=A0AAD5TI73_9FUNG|nr:hypothetical protein HDU87_008633 [Geranomyces variabilis]